jgi:membrane protease YdiL (CAAX protease family)
MNPYLLPMIGIAVIYFAIVIANERWDLFRGDRFASPGMKYLAYGWLGLLFLLLTVLVTGGALHTPTPREIAATPFWSLFILHIILVIFLWGWWLMTQRPPLREFLNIRREGVGQATMAGFAIGIGGWIVTLVIAAAVVSLLSAAGFMPKDLKPSPMIPWMAALPLWKKGLIVLSAMTIEEAFFRGFLQKRVGLLASTALFAIAHSGFGQPFLLVGVSVISLVIGFTFYRTKNLIPGIIAHGVFDAVQLFVVIPAAFRLSGLGG